MAEEMKLAKRLRMFKNFDEATIVAAITTTGLDYRDLKNANEAMENLYNNCNDIQENQPKTTASPVPKQNKEQLFKLFMDQFLKDLVKYELSQDLDRFQIGIGGYLSFRQQMFGDFNIRLRDAYLTEIDKVQKGINRVDLLLAHDRGFIGNQEQSAHDPKFNGSWKERVQTLGYSHRTISNYMNFYQLSSAYPRILTSSAYFSEWCTFLPKIKEEITKNTTLSIRCSQPLMME